MAALTLLAVGCGWHGLGKSATFLFSWPSCLHHRGGPGAPPKANLGNLLLAGISAVLLVLAVLLCVGDLQRVLDSKSDPAIVKSQDDGGPW